MQAPSLYSYFDSKNAIYDAMFAEGARKILEVRSAMTPTEDPLADLRQVARTFVEFCVEDPARYQLLFQRTIPGFEPSPESYALATETLELTQRFLARAGLADQRDLDLFTAVTEGLAAQQIANEPGGDRWVRLVDEAMDMYVAHIRKVKEATNDGRRC